MCSMLLLLLYATPAVLWVLDRRLRGQNTTLVGHSLIHSPNIMLSQTINVCGHVHTQHNINTQQQQQHQHHIAALY